MVTTDDTPSPQQTGAEEKPSSASYSFIIREQLPYYLSIGMTITQYLDEDTDIARWYRKADEIKKKRRNQELWLQGMYVYEAILDAAPMLHAFAKKGTKPIPYPSEPYPITAKDAAEKEEREAEHKFKKQLATMQAAMTMINKKIKERGDDNGNP